MLPSGAQTDGVVLMMIALLLKRRSKGRNAIAGIIHWLPREARGSRAVPG